MSLELWNKLSRPPREALKTIKGGRLAGMTDINPQWRFKAMTETFGPCGSGWKYEIAKLWTEPGPDGSVMAFALVNLWVSKTQEKHVLPTAGLWADPIPGIGGSAIVAKESSGLRANDEAYKMAVTDALSVAMKALGVGADIYAGLWDGTKYADAPKTAHKPSDGAMQNLPEDRQGDMRSFADEVMGFMKTGKIKEAVEWIAAANLTADEHVAFWDLLPSGERTAIKRKQDAMKNAA